MEPPSICAAVPEDRPFVLYLKPFAHLMRHGRVELGLMVPFGLLLTVGGLWMLGSGETTYESTRYGEIPAPLVNWGAIAVGLYLMVIYPIILARRSRGPVLAADTGGLFIRPNLEPKRALRLPWESIESITVRAQRGPNLCVKPVDPRVETPFELANSANRPRGGGASYGLKVAQKRRMRRLGTNISIPIGGATLSPDEILEQLHRLSAGRDGSGGQQRGYDAEHVDQHVHDDAEAEGPRADDERRQDQLQ